MHLLPYYKVTAIAGRALPLHRLDRVHARLHMLKKVDDRGLVKENPYMRIKGTLKCIILRISTEVPRTNEEWDCLWQLLSSLKGFVDNFLKALRPNVGSFHHVPEKHEA